MKKILTLTMISIMILSAAAHARTVSYRCTCEGSMLSAEKRCGYGYNNANKGKIMNGLSKTNLKNFLPSKDRDTLEKEGFARSMVSGWLCLVRKN